MNDVLIPFGKNKKTQLIQYVDEVAGGLACNCTCISCGEDLVAVNGDRLQVRPHFKHKPRANSDEILCDFNMERALFWLVMDIIKSKDTLTIPHRVLHTPKMFGCEEKTVPVSDQSKVQLKNNYSFSEKENVSITLKIETYNVDYDLTFAFSQNILNEHVLNANTNWLYIDLSRLLKIISNSTQNLRELVERYIERELCAEAWIFNISDKEAETQITEAIAQSAASMYSNRKTTQPFAKYEAPERPSVEQNCPKKNTLKTLKKRSNLYVSAEEARSQLDKLVAEAIQLFQSNNAVVKRCRKCLHMSAITEITENCDICGDKNFEKVELTDKFIRSLKSRYWQQNFGERSLRAIKEILGIGQK